MINFSQRTGISVKRSGSRKFNMLGEPRRVGDRWVAI